MTSNLLNRLMSQATVKERSDGTFLAYIQPTAHRAFGNGGSHTEALSDLHAQVVANLAAVCRSFRILTGREP